MSVPATAAPAAPAAESEAPSTGQAGAIPAQEQRADPTPASRAETQEQVTRGPDYFREAFRAIRGQTQSAQAAPEAPAPVSPAPQAPPASSRPVQEPERSEASPSGPATTLPAAPRGPAPAPRPPSATPPADRIVLSQAELERRVQAEADRKLAKQQADEKARRDRELEVELRDTNPFEYARMMRDREAKFEESQAENKRLTGLLDSQLTAYDRKILDPLVSALPEHLRREVIADEVGIDGRHKTVQATLKTLRQTWVNEGRETAKAALLKDPTFIKEVLARYGGQTPEPEAVQARPSAGPTPSGADGMNSWMRSAARGIRSGG